MKSEIKEVYYSLNEKKRKQIITHIANGIYVDFFYIEFNQLNISHNEMIAWLLYEQNTYYSMNGITFNNYLNHYEQLLKIEKSKLSTIEEIDELKYIIYHDIIYLLDAFQYMQKDRQLGEQNSDIAGYYINDDYISTSLPENLLQKIFSANKYITLINKDFELMIAMEHKGKHSLFYSHNDQ